MPDDDANDFGFTLRRFLERESPESRVRQEMVSVAGYDQQLWRRSAQELGLQGLGIAEAHGGSGATPPVLGVAFQELGRALVTAPFLSTGLAALAVAYACDDATGGPLLRRIASGDAVAALAWAGENPARSSLSIEAGRVSGTADIVIDGGSAELLLVAARSPDGELGLYETDGGLAEVSRTSLVALDSTRRLTRIDFTAAPVQPLATRAAGALTQAYDMARLLLAAEQLGGAERVLEMAVDYAKNRVQFGRRIGSFQAVKHRCADMLVDVELARSLVFHALTAVGEDAATLPLEAALVGSFVSDAYVRLAAANLQIHGGMGFTWEHPAHLYLKRAKSSQLIFGNPVSRRRQLAGHLGIAGPVAGAA